MSTRAWVGCLDMTLALVYLQFWSSTKRSPWEPSPVKEDTWTLPIHWHPGQLNQAAFHLHSVSPLRRERRSCSVYALWSISSCGSCSAQSGYLWIGERRHSHTGWKSLTLVDYALRWMNNNFNHYKVIRCPAKSEIIFIIFVSFYIIYLCHQIEDLKLLCDTLYDPTDVCCHHTPFSFELVKWRRETVQYPCHSHSISMGGSLLLSEALKRFATGGKLLREVLGKVMYPFLKSAIDATKDRHFANST